MAETITALVGAVACFALGLRVPTRPGAAVLALVMAAVQTALGFEEFPNVEIAFATLGPWWAGRELRLRNHVLAELALRTGELEAAEDAFTRLAVRRERARIAAELHDLVSHHVSVIVIHAGAGRLAGEGGSVSAPARLAAIRESGAAAVDDMRRLVSMLGEDATLQPRHAGGHAVDGIARLTADVRAAGPHVRLQLPPPGATIGPAAADAAHAVVREALTNARKHAPGAALTVELRLDRGSLVVEVRDRGAAAASPLAASGSGIGIAGMRERVAALGGTLEAGPHGRGWAVRARLPAQVAR